METELEKLSRKLSESETLVRVLQEKLIEEKTQFSIATYAIMFVAAAIYCIFVGNSEVAASSSPIGTTIEQLILSVAIGGLFMALSLIMVAIISGITTNEKIICSIGIVILVVILIL